MASYTNKELDIVRKHFNEEKLTPAERRILSRATKRVFKDSIIEIAAVCAVVLPVVAFVVRTCVWK
jgi:hypothetical protein